MIDARDDHGVSALAIVSRRISRLGVEDPERRDALPVPDGAPDRLIVPHLFDLGNRALLPGDTVRYYAIATDNAPRGRTGRSREYVLRLPTMAEVRAAEREATESVGAQLDSLAAASKQLQRQTEDLSREASRSSAEQPGRRDASAMSFEEAKRAEAVARQQEELVRQAEEARAAIEDLQRAAAETGTQDPEFQKRMQEIAEQIDRALTPEMRQQLEELRQALSQLDAARSRQALEELAEAQRKLKEALERSQKLFERAAVEGEMANMEAEARELAQEQGRWNDDVARADSAQSAAQEEALAERADSLASAMRETAQSLDKMQQAEQADRMEATAEMASTAAQEMKQAAASAKQGKPQEAKQQGKQAEQKLQSLGDAVERAAAGCAGRVEGRGGRRDRPDDGGDESSRRPAARHHGGAEAGRVAVDVPGPAGGGGGGGREADGAIQAGVGRERAGAPADRRYARGGQATDDGGAGCAVHGGARPA